MKGLIPVFMTILFLTGFTLGDETPLLNAYEVVRHSGAAFLPESGTHYIADQAKLGKYALLTAWGVWVAASAVFAFVFVRFYRFIR